MRRAAAAALLAYAVSGAFAADAFSPAPGSPVLFPETVACAPALEAEELAVLTAPFLERTLQFASGCEAGAVTLAALVPPGAPLFTASLENGRATEESRIPVSLPPLRNFLGDFLLAKLPATAWAGRLPCGWTLSDEGRERVLRDADGDEVERIAYESAPSDPAGVLWLQNRAWGYRVTVRRLTE